MSTQSGPNWYDHKNPDFTSDPSRYRVKPWTLSRHIPGFRKLEDGEGWMLSEVWTEERLPHGFRPLLVGEDEHVGDQVLMFGKWVSIKRHAETRPENMVVLRRTLRPLPPTKTEKEREEFEAWVAKEYTTLSMIRSRNGEYHSSDTRLTFYVWQAARKQKEAK